MKWAALISLLGCASSLSCSTYMPSVAPEQRPTGREAIVYGRFGVSGASPFSSDQDHSSMALVLRCEDGREYRIRFDDGEPIIVLAIAPSTCWLDEMLFLDADNTTLGQTVLPDRVRRAMRLHARRAYYLGDFSGTVTLEFSGGIGRAFEVKEARNEFTATTQEFRQQFPNLRGFTPVDVTSEPKDDYVFGRSW